MSALLLTSCTDSPTTGLRTAAGGARLSVTPTVLILDDGESGNFEAQLLDASGVAIRARELEWTSLSPGVATVSNGFVNAKHPGEARVRVRAPKHDAETDVTVIVRPVADDVLFIVRDEVHHGLAGEALDDSVEVRVIDRGGLPVPGVTVEFEVETGGGTVSPFVVTTNERGYARAEWTLGPSVGANALLVSDAAGAASPGPAPPGKKKQKRSKIHAWGKPGTPHSVEVTPAADTVGINDSNRLFATVYDRWRNVVQDASVVWTSSASEVALVDGIGNVVGQSEGTATISATVATGSGSSGALAPPEQVVSGNASIAVKRPEGTSLARLSGNGQAGTVGTTLPQPLVVNVRNAAGEPVKNFQVSWSVSSGNGSLSATETMTDGSGNADVEWTLGSTPGQQQVTAWSGGTNAVAFTATATLGEASTIVVTPTSLSLEVGGSDQLNAVALDGFGNEITDRPVSWHTTDGVVANVDVGGFVTALSPGSAQIEARLDEAVGSAAVTVTGDSGGGDGGGTDGGDDGGGSEPASWRVVINPAESTLSALGAQDDLVATVTDGDGRLVAGADVAWESLSPEVVSVDDFGRITSQALGVAMIVATIGNGSADTATVQSQQVVASIDVSPAELRVKTGTEATLTASAVDSLGSTVENATFEWITTDTEIALIAESGSGSATVTAGSGGLATVVAKKDGVTGTSEIMVDAPPTVGLEVVETTDDSVTIDVTWSGTGTHRIDLRQDSASADGVDNGFPGSSTRFSVVDLTADGGRHRVAVARLNRPSWTGARVRWEPAGQLPGDWGYSAALEIPGKTSPPPPPPPEGSLRAFPGAEGFGAGSMGGRGGAVYVVTSLDDNPSSPQPGTLRYALMQTHPRTVVFAVAGEIRFGQMRLSSSHSNLTIAGQTAPGSGITLDGSLLVMGASDVTVRYVRFRRYGNNGFAMIQGSDVILDHVSVQFHTDDAFKIWVDQDHNGAGPVSRVTLSRSIVGPTTKKGIGGGWRGNDLKGDNLLVSDVDYHHNLFANNSHRTPRTSAQRARVVNNVVYNSRYKFMESVHQVDIDYIANYMKEGPMTASGDRWILHEAHPNGEPDQLYPMAKIHASGNIAAPLHMDGGSDNWHLVLNGFTREPLPTTYQRVSPLSAGAYPITIQSAADAYSSVLSDVGANRRVTCEGNWAWNQDALDASVVTHVRDGTGPSAPYDSPDQAGGFPSVTQGSPCSDGDGDGMPDAFETRYGLNPESATDASQDADGDGYTNIEEYINATAAR